MWLDSRHISPETIQARIESKSSFWKAFTRALFITLSNPKNGVFYVAALPQFLPTELPALLGGFILATIHNVLVFTWFSLIILGAGFAQSAQPTGAENCGTRFRASSDWFWHQSGFRKELIFSVHLPIT
jgi:threonine/homoserine/homoserine lactone efflux protein